MANHIRLFHVVMVLASLRLCAYSEPLLLENESVYLVFSAPISVQWNLPVFIAVRDLPSLRPCADSLERSLRKIRLTKIRCSYPEGGTGGSVQCLATIGPTAKCHLNGVSLAGR